MSNIKIDIDKVHENKTMFQRANGKSVDAIMDVIGKVLVTENATVPFVIKNMTWTWHLTSMFFSICQEHFKEVPIIKRQDEWHIKGYSSRIKIISWDRWEEENDRLRGCYSTDPTFDLR